MNSQSWKILHKRYIGNSTFQDMVQPFVGWLGQKFGMATLLLAKTGDPCAVKSWVQILKGLPKYFKAAAVRSWFRSH